MAEFITGMNSLLALFLIAALGYLIGAIKVKGIELGTSYKIYVEKGGTLALPADFTAHAVYEEDGKTVAGTDFALIMQNP